MAGSASSRGRAKASRPQLGAEAMSAEEAGEAGVAVRLGGRDPALAHSRLFRAVRLGAALGERMDNPEWEAAAKDRVGRGDAAMAVDEAPGDELTDDDRARREAGMRGHIMGATVQDVVESLIETEVEGDADEERGTRLLAALSERLEDGGELEAIGDRSIGESIALSARTWGWSRTGASGPTKRRGTRPWARRLGARGGRSRCTSRREALSSSPAGGGGPPEGWWRGICRRGLCVCVKAPSVASRQLPQRGSSQVRAFAVGEAGWCPRSDSNQHVSRQQILSLPRLPFRHWGLAGRRALYSCAAGRQRALGRQAHSKVRIGRAA